VSPVGSLASLAQHTFGQAQRDLTDAVISCCQHMAALYDITRWRANRCGTERRAVVCCSRLLPRLQLEGRRWDLLLAEVDTPDWPHVVAHNAPYYATRKTSGATTASTGQDADGSRPARAPSTATACCFRKEPVHRGPCGRVRASSTSQAVAFWCCCATGNEIGTCARLRVARCRRPRFEAPFGGTRIFDPASDRSSMQTCRRCWTSRG